MKLSNLKNSRLKNYQRKLNCCQFKTGETLSITIPVRDIIRVSIANYLKKPTK